MSCDEPVPALSGHAADLDFCYWRGRSGRRYLHTIYPLAEWPGYKLANVLFVRIDRLGRRRVVWAGQIPDKGSRDMGSADMGPGARPPEPFEEVLRRMKRLGADEVHVHLLAEDEAARDAVEEDLRAGLLGTEQIR